MGSMAPLSSKKTSNTCVRGYLWLSLLIILLLIGLLIWGAIRGRNISEFATDSMALSQVDSGAASQDYSKRPYSSRHSRQKYASSRDFFSGSKESVPISHTNPQPSSPPVFAPAKPFVFELNSADTNDLQELYGIGSYFAKAIVRYRERLGGFVSREQLLEVPGMTPERYQKALSNTICNIDPSLCRPIDVNNISLQELKRHPYLDYWQAKGIVQLREKGVRFRDPEDLLQVPLIDTATLRRLTPYLSFE